jgi:hypothetical protein
VSFGRRAWSALGKFGIVLSVIIIFVFGFLGTVYLSLKTAEVKVPNVLGKNRLAGESALDDAGLSIRVARTRASADQPDTILQQWPAEGQIVKTGQTVAVEISRAPKEGESVPSKADVAPQENTNSSQNANANQSTTANQNQTQNQNKAKNKNTNKNANNSNNKNANNTNGARNANNTNANVAGRNANANRATTNANPNTNSTPNANRGNANKRPPVTKPTPAGGANKVPE